MKFEIDRVRWLLSRSMADRTGAKSSENSNKFFGNLKILLLMFLLQYFGFFPGMKGSVGRSEYCI